MTGAERPFAFAGPAPDRADHLRDDDAALAALWPSARILAVDAKGGIIANAGGDAPWSADAATLDADLRVRASFLARDGERAWFALPAEALPAVPFDAPRVDLRSAASTFGETDARLFAYARALLHWQARKRFCGVCGQPLAIARAGHLARCAQCGSEWYPRTDAAIIVLVSDGERILLGRQASWPPKRYSVLAGFVEPGESLEDAVRREVMEEAGIRVSACRYVASQPWPFPASLMVGFRADAEPDAPRCGPELEDARWFDAAGLRASVAADEIRLSPPLSISHRLIADWLAVKR